jgi:hypothetical protein
MPMLTPPESDPADLDPNQEIFWTLPMAIAWIAWRDPTKVRDQWDQYRKACWKRAEKESPRGTLPPLLRASVAAMSLREGPKTSFINWLFCACAEGKINAIGNNATGRPVKIPAHEFSVLTLHSVSEELPWGTGVTPGLGQEPQLAGFKDLLVFDVNRFEPAYLEIKFRRDEIKRKWPMSDASAKRHMAKAKAEEMILAESSHKKGRRISQKAAAKLFVDAGVIVDRATVVEIVKKHWGNSRGRPKK